MTWLALILTATVTAETPVLFLARDTDTPPPHAATVVERVDVARRAASRFWTIRAVRRDEVSVPDAPLRSCGPEPNCLASVLRGTGVRGVVYMLSNWAAAEPLFSVAVIDLDQRAVAATVFGDDATSKDGVEALVRKALSAAGHGLGATLELNVSPPSARVDLEPQVIVAPRRLIPPGRYDVVITADGYEPHRETIELTAGQRRTFDVRLTEVAGPLETWWFWTAVGVVVVGTAAGLTAAGVFTRDTLVYGEPP